MEGKGVIAFGEFEKSLCFADLAEGFEVDGGPRLGANKESAFLKRTANGVGVGHNAGLKAPEQALCRICA